MLEKKFGNSDTIRYFCRHIYSNEGEQHESKEIIL